MADCDRRVHRGVDILMKYKEAANAIFDRIKVKAVDADIATLERLASAYKLTREGMAWAPHEPKPLIIVPPSDTSAK